MARRINTKFIVFLGLGVVVLGVAMAATWYVASRRSAAATLREANEAMAAGEYLHASKLFARAAGHKQFENNTELMINASHANARIPVTELRDAQTYLQTQMAWLSMASRRNPRDPVPLQMLMDLRVRLAEEMDQDAEWDALYGSTKEMLETYPDLQLAVKYRGISQIERMARATAIKPTATERLQIAEDLRSTMALENHADDRECIKYLAWWHVLEAGFLDHPGGDKEQVAKLRGDAIELTETGLANHPDDVDRLIDHIFILMMLEKAAKAEPYTLRLEKRLLAEAASPQKTSVAIRLILRQRMERLQRGKTTPITTEFYERCERLVRTANDAHPNSPQLAFTLGTLLSYQQKPEDALKIFDDTWNASVESTPLVFIRGRNYRMLCGVSSLEIMADTIGSIEGEEQRKKTLDEMQAKLEVITGQVGDRPALSKLAGRISFARGNYQDATRQTDEAITAGDQSLRTLLKSAQARMKLQEWGAAAERYEAIVAQWPDVTPVRYALAGLYVRQRMYSEAQPHLDELEKQNEQNERWQHLKLYILLGRKQFDEADALLSEVNVADNPNVTIRAARAYLGADRKETAIRLLEDAFNERPKNVSLLNWLIDLENDDQKKLAYVEQGEQAGMNEEWVGRLRKLIGGEVDVRKQIDGLIKEKIEQEEDPVTQALQWYVYFMRQDDVERAREELSKISEDDRNTAPVIEALFRDALTRRDFKEAESIAARAGDVNDGRGADLAKGAFYRARAHMAQGRHDEAVSALHEGLEMREVYSRGWETLGLTLLRTQEYRSAIEAFSTALKQRPTSARALSGLAVAYHNIGDTEAALTSLRHLYRYHSQNYNSADKYFRYEQEYGDAERVLELRQEHAERNPTNLRNRRAIALTLSHLNRHDEAKEQLDEVIAEDGLTLSNVITRAAILYDADEVDVAIDELRAYVQSKDNDPQARDYYLVARQLRAMDQRKEAISTYRQASTIEGEYQRAAKTALAQLLMETNDGIDESVQLHKDLWDSDPKDLQASATYARALLQKNQIDEAETVLRAIVAEHGNTVQTLVLEAQIAAMRGSITEAETLLEAAIEKRPKAALLYLAKAELLSKDPKRHGNALADLDHALEIDPLLDDARQLRASIQRVRGDTSAAIFDLEAIVQNDENRPETRKELARLYGATRQFRKLDALLEESANLFPDEPFWPHRQAFRARSMHKLIEAIEKMKVAFELDESASTLSDLVTMTLEAQKPDMALNLLNKHTVMMNESPVLMVLRGQAVMKTKGRREAIELFAEALKRTEKYGGFQVVRNLILRSLDPGTTRDLIVSTFGDSPPIWVVLGVADIEIQAADFETALERLRPLAPTITEQATEEQKFFNRVFAIALHQTQRFDEAAEAYRRQLELEPDNWVVMNNLSYLLVDNLDKPEEAVKTMERAVKIRENDPQLLDTLGFALYKTGRNKQAADVLERSVKLRPQATTIIHLVDVLLVMHNTARATELLQEAKQSAERTNDVESLNQINERLNALAQPK